MFGNETIAARTARKSIGKRQTRGSKYNFQLLSITIGCCCCYYYGKQGAIERVAGGEEFDGQPAATPQPKVVLDITLWFTCVVRC